MEGEIIVWMILQACFSNTTQNNHPVETLVSPSIVGQPWVLLESTGYQRKQHKIVLEFFDNNQLDLDCNCNDNYGRYTVEGTKLNVLEIGGTEKACLTPPFDSPERIYDDESFLMRFLLEDPDIRRDGDFLLLTTEDTSLRFGPERLLPPAPKRVNFYDTTWMLDGISTVDGPIVRLQDGSPSVEFGWHNQFVLQTGCNEGRGRYTVKSDSIDVEMVEFTENICSPEELSRMDTALKTFFTTSTLKVHKNVGEMTFTSRDIEVSLFAKSSE